MKDVVLLATKDIPVSRFDNFEKRSNRPIFSTNGGSVLSGLDGFYVRVYVEIPSPIPPLTVILSRLKMLGCTHYGVPSHRQSAFFLIALCRILNLAYANSFVSGLYSWARQGQRNARCKFATTSVTREELIGMAVQTREEVVGARRNDGRGLSPSGGPLLNPRFSQRMVSCGYSKGSVTKSAFSFDLWAPILLMPGTFRGEFVPTTSTSDFQHASIGNPISGDFDESARQPLSSQRISICAISNVPHQGSQKFGAFQVSSNATASDSFVPSSDYPLIMVVGKSCAGKTTFGEYASNQHGRFHIEASRVMRDIADLMELSDHRPVDVVSKEVISRSGQDVVAREIVRRYAHRLDRGAVISGFRTLEEVEFIRTQYPLCRIVLVEASIRTRFARHLNRGRLKGIRSVDVFAEYERSQWSFGFFGRIRGLADLRVENMGTFREYHEQIDLLLAGDYRSLASLPSSEFARK